MRCVSVFDNAHCNVHMCTPIQHNKSFVPASSTVTRLVFCQ